MPVRAVCKPHSPDLRRGALATDARGCSLWRSLLERPPPAPESRVRDPLGELVWTRVGGVTQANEISINKSNLCNAEETESAHEAAFRCIYRLMQFKKIIIM